MNVATPPPSADSSKRLSSIPTQPEESRSKPTSLSPRRAEAAQETDSPSDSPSTRIKSSKRTHRHKKNKSDVPDPETTEEQLATPTKNSSKGQEKTSPPSGSESPIPAAVPLASKSKSSKSASPSHSIASSEPTSPRDEEHSSSASATLTSTSTSQSSASSDASTETTKPNLLKHATSEASGRPKLPGSKNVQMAKAASPSLMSSAPSPILHSHTTSSLVSHKPMPVVPTSVHATPAGGNVSVPNLSEHMPLHHVASHIHISTPVKLPSAPLGSNPGSRIFQSPAQTDVSRPSLPGSRTLLPANDGSSTTALKMNAPPHLSVRSGSGNDFVDQHNALLTSPVPTPSSSSAAPVTAKRPLLPHQKLPSGPSPVVSSTLKMPQPPPMLPGSAALARALAPAPAVDVPTSATFDPDVPTQAGNSQSKNPSSSLGAVLPPIEPNTTQIVFSNRGLTEFPRRILDTHGFSAIIGSGNELSDLPLALAHKTDITRLEFASNQFKELPHVITDLPNLKYLDFSRNKISLLPPGMASMTSLTTLLLANNRLKSFPNHLCSLVHLEHLDLSGNRLKTLPPSFGDLSALVDVHLANCELESLPVVIGRLRKLETLVLHHNHLSKLPAELGVLSSLKSLDLGYNAFVSTPVNLFYATALTDLNLQRNEIVEVAEDVLRLANLKKLNLEDNRLQALPGELSHLTQLTQIKFAGNALSAIPVEYLQDSSTMMEWLTKRRLQSAWKRRKLVFLGEEFVGKTSLRMQLMNSYATKQSRKRRKHRGNELQHAAANPAVAAVKDAPMPSLATASAPGLFSSSSTSVGNIQNASNSNTAHASSTASAAASNSSSAASGTTSIANLAVAQSFASSSPSISPRNKQDSQGNLQSYLAELADPVATDGIDIEDWEPLGTDEDGLEPIVFSTWDFAGQQIYYPTHQFFITNRSIYLIIFNMMEERTSRVEYWLKTLRVRTDGKSPVVIVGTHADDKRCDAKYVETLFKSMSKKYLNRFPFLREFVAVSSKSGKGLGKLTEILVNLARSQASFKHIPDSYSKLEKGLLQIRTTTNTMTRSDFEGCAVASGVDRNDVTPCLEFLHDVGLIVYFNDKRSGLSELVIMDPLWIVNLLSSVITLKHSYVKDGIMMASALPQIWKEYPASEYNWLLKLLDKYEITFRIHSSSSPSDPTQDLRNRWIRTLIQQQQTTLQMMGSPMGNVLFDSSGRRKGAGPGERIQSIEVGSLTLAQDMIVIPSLLPVMPAEEHLSELWTDPALFDGSICGRRYIFQFLPLGFFSRLLVRTLHMSGIIPQYLWRDGMIVDSDTERAILLHDELDYQLDIIVRTKTRPRSNSTTIEDLAAANSAAGSSSTGRRHTITSSFNLLRQLSDCVETLLVSWFKLKVIVKVPCHLCLRQKMYEDPSIQPYYFPIEECMLAVREGKDSVECHAEQTPSFVAPSNKQKRRYSAHVPSSNTSSTSSSSGGSSGSIRGNSGGSVKGASSTSTPSSSHHAIWNLFSSSIASANAANANNAASTTAASGEKGALGVETASTLNSTNAQSTSNPVATGGTNSQPTTPRGGSGSGSGKDSPPPSLVVTRPHQRQPSTPSSSSSTNPSASGTNPPSPPTASVSEKPQHSRTPSLASAQSEIGGSVLLSLGSLNAQQSTSDILAHQNRHVCLLKELCSDIAFSDVSDLTINFEDLNVGKVIGEGSYAELRTGTYQGEMVAVKVLKHQSGSGGRSQEMDLLSDSFRELQHETFVMKALKNQYLVELKGICTHPLAMVMDYFPLGSLDRHLRDTSVSHPCLSWKYRVRLALNIARGMDYLHSEDFMHRDLRSPNILIASRDENDAVVAKVADFGLAVICAKELKGGDFNECWTAPEILKAVSYNSKVDVYSFGIVMWELLELGHPFKEYEEIYAKLPRLDFFEAIIGGLRPTFPSNCPKDYQGIVCACWATEAEERPTFARIAERLAEMEPTAAQWDIGNIDATSTPIYADAPASSSSLRNLLRKKSKGSDLHKRVQKMGGSSPAVLFAPPGSPLPPSHFK